ncbi:MAG: methyl-accepting chemotaxis protein [Bacillota bacterium]|nr:methyl-accepting chemotaxis protein [Bacillota bacterium]
MKLKTKMLVSILIPVLLVIMALSLVSYLYSRNLLIEESMQNVENMAKKYGSDIETILSQKLAYIEISANSIENSDFDDEKMLADLTYLTNNVAESLGFFVFFSDGKYLDGTGWIPDASFDPKSRDWYKNAMDSETVIVSPPYVSAATNTMIVTISKKIRRDGKPVGVIGSDITIKQLEDIVKGIQLEETGKAYLVDGNGRFMVHETFTFDDSLESLESDPNKPLTKKILNGTETVFTNETEGIDRLYAKYNIEGTDWKLVLYAPEKEVVKASRSLAVFMGIIGIASIALLIVIVFVIAGSITKPILRLSTCVEDMVNYDFTLTEQSPSVIYSKRNDEIGLISRSLIKVKETIKDMIINIQDIANQVSASSEELTATSEDTATLAEGIANAVSVISQNASLQDQTMHEGDEAMKVMDKELLSNQDIIENLNRETKAVVVAKENGIATISDLVDSTEKTKQSTVEITEVISNTNEKAIAIASASDMIKSIADQTNLLALNAAIEAARAGEAGKGFAVVAEEIRKLAEQSNTFTEEIKEIVIDLTDKTSEAVDIMNAVGVIVSEQGSKVSETKDQFFAISEAIDKNESEIDRLNRSKEELESTKASLLSIIKTLTELSGNNYQSTVNVADSIDRQTASSQEVASASANLASMAQELIEMIAKFKI